MAAIKYRLKEMMKAQKVSAPKLATRSGVPLGSIKSILNGLSKNPRASTLGALARAFNCDIAALLSEDALTQSQPASNQAMAIEDYLFKEAIEKVEEITKAQGVSLEGQDELKRRCVMRIYQYAMERSKGQTIPKVDNVYASWVIERELEV